MFNLFPHLTPERWDFLVVATLSGVGGSVLHVFDSFEGTIIHEKRMHPSRNGQLYSQRTLGVDVAFGASRIKGINHSAKDLFVLTNGHTVGRIDGTRGDLLWSWTAPEQAFVDYLNLVFPYPDRASGLRSYSDALQLQILRFTLSGSQNRLPRTPSMSLPSLQKQGNSWRPNTSLQRLRMALMIFSRCSPLLLTIHALFGSRRVL